MVNDNDDNQIGNYFVQSKLDINASMEMSKKLPKSNSNGSEVAREPSEQDKDGMREFSLRQALNFIILKYFN